MSDLLFLLTSSASTSRLSDDDIVARLRAASTAMHGEYSEWQRGHRCLLEIAAKRLIFSHYRYDAARKANARMRHQRNEARAGVIGADWWYDANDPESSYSDPSDALNDTDLGQIVEMTGAAEVETSFGFRIGPAPGAESDDDREFWFPTEAEAIAKLAELRTADATAQAKIDGESP